MVKLRGDSGEEKGLEFGADSSHLYDRFILYTYQNRSQ